VRHVRVDDAWHELPPANHFGARKTRRPSHIYSAKDIDRLIEAALRLRPKGGLRSLTYATLIALLSATGLRISEAVPASGQRPQLRDPAGGEAEPRCDVALGKGGG
jgi:integrase